jgi:very-short-patch-repair endonuclease
MSYLIYSKEFQNDVVRDKELGIKVFKIVKKFNISIYTLYKILHMNGKMPIPSQALEGISSKEGVEHRNLSPNNNDSQERSTSTWKNYGSCRHKKIKHICLNCEKEFMARDRGSRIKFCSKKCRAEYQTRMNSTIKICPCGNKFKVKNSIAKTYIFCEQCRKNKLRYPTSIMAMNIIRWLEEDGFNVEREKTFEWFHDKNKPKGRFRLDAFLPDYSVGIEYDGEQHFKPCFTSNQELVEKVRYRDKLKTKLCNENDIDIIRFKYNDPINKNYVLMKIYAELQGNELVEVEDKKPLR